MDLGNIELKWLGHSGFLIKNEKIIYIDPYNLREGFPPADIVLITHSHYDHCSFGDLKKIVQEGTRIICPADCQSKIARFEVSVKIDLVEPFKEMDLGDVVISTIPAYNKDKHFHPKEESWVGYIVKMHNVLIYHAGDSDLIPEMQKLTGHKQPGKEFVALLPIGGRFTMNVEEAVEAAKLIKPTLVIPMHWGSIIGSEDDAKEFKEICEENNIKCEVLNKE